MSKSTAADETHFWRHKTVKSVSKYNKTRME